MTLCLYIRIFFSEYDVFLLVTQAYSDKVKKNPSAPNRSRTYDLRIEYFGCSTTELQETRCSEAIKLGS